MNTKISRLLIFLTVLCLGLCIFLYLRTAAAIKEGRALEERQAESEQMLAAKKDEAEALKQRYDALTEENAEKVKEYRIWEHEIEKIAPYLY